MKIKKYLFIPVLLFFNCVYGQSEIAAFGGIQQSGFYGTLDKSMYTSHYKQFMNYGASVLYKEQITDRLFAGLEVESTHIRSNIEISEVIKMGGPLFYNALLDLDYLNLHFLYGIQLLGVKKISCFASADPYFGFLVHSKAAGTGGRPSSHIEIDSSGQEHTIISNQSYEINESPTQLLRKANVGVRLNMDVHFKINDKWGVLLKGSYSFGIYGVLKDHVFVGIQGYAFSAGVSYQLEKKYLCFSEWKKYAKPKNANQQVE